MKVLKFGAVWCSGCLVMRPRWKEIEKEYTWLKTEYYDFDADKKEVERYHIDSGTLPVFVILDKNDKEIARLHGEVEKKKIIALMQQYRDS